MAIENGFIYLHDKDLFVGNPISVFHYSDIKAPVFKDRAEEYLEKLNNGEYIITHDINDLGAGDLDIGFTKIKTKQYINVFTKKDLSNVNKYLPYVQYTDKAINNVESFLQFERKDKYSLTYSLYYQPTKKTINDILNIHLLNKKELLAEGWALDFCIVKIEKKERSTENL